MVEMEVIKGIWSYLHLHCTLGTQIGAHHILETLGGTDVYGQGLGGAGELGLGVQQANRSHGFKTLFYRVKSKKIVATK